MNMPDDEPSRDYCLMRILTALAELQEAVEPMTRTQSTDLIGRYKWKGLEAAIIEAKQHIRTMLVRES